MPRNVRNFWIEARIDGRPTTITGGPQRANGGFSMIIRQRNDGSVGRGLMIDGYVEPDGRLVLVAEASDGQRVKVETIR